MDQNFVADTFIRSQSIWSLLRSEREASHRVFLYSKTLCRAIFMKNRFLWIMGLRTLAIILEASTSRFAEPPRPTIIHVLKTIFSGSPVANLTFVSLALRLPFRQHIFLQLILFLLSLTWIQPFCQSCTDRSQIFQKVNFLSER